MSTVLKMGKIWNFYSFSACNLLVVYLQQAALLLIPKVTTQMHVIYTIFIFKMLIKYFKATKTFCVQKNSCIVMELKIFMQY